MSEEAYQCFNYVCPAQLLKWVACVFRQINSLGLGNKIKWSKVIMIGNFVNFLSEIRQYTARSN